METSKRISQIGDNVKKKFHFSFRDDKLLKEHNDKSMLRLPRTQKHQMLNEFLNPSVL